MAKVLLVNPALGYSSWNAPLTPPTPDNNFIRLGLAYLAGALMGRGHEVKLADLRTLAGWGDYIRILSDFSPDWVGISVHSVEAAVAEKAADLAKSTVPGVRTAVGGIHATMFPDECLGKGVFDYVIMGEGEISFPQLVETPEKFPGSFWGETPDLDKIPFPVREIWPDFETRTRIDPIGLQNYRFPLPLAEMINTRGCPYSCTFCCGPGEHQLYTKVSPEGKRTSYIRGRSVSNVIAEMEMLISKFGIKSVWFHDDQFILGNGDWVREFIKALHDTGMVKYGLRWVTSSRADIICRHDELIGEMAQAGLEMLIVGFESFSPRVLKWFKKMVTAEQNHRAAEILHKHGVKIWANYILGVRTDTGYHKEDDFMTVEGVLRARPVHFSPATYTPIPGSKLYGYYKENGLILLDEQAEQLGDRGARIPKVKGIDYDFVNALIIEDSFVI